MTWARFDDKYDENPKVAEVGPLGGWVHVRAICYCARNETDGRIPRGKLLELAACGLEFDADPREIVASLLRVPEGKKHGLIEEIPGDPRAYLVHDYLEYNPSAADLEKERGQGKRRAAESYRKRKTTSSPDSSHEETESLHPKNTPKNTPKNKRIFGRSSPDPVPDPVPVPDPDPETPPARTHGQEHTREARPTAGAAGGGPRQASGLGPRDRRDARAEQEPADDESATPRGRPTSVQQPGPNGPPRAPNPELADTVRAAFTEAQGRAPHAQWEAELRRLQRIYGESALVRRLREWGFAGGKGLKALEDGLRLGWDEEAQSRRPLADVVGTPEEDAEEAARWAQARKFREEMEAGAEDPEADAFLAQVKAHATNLPLGEK